MPPVVYYCDGHAPLLALSLDASGLKNVGDFSLA